MLDNIFLPLESLFSVHLANFPSSYHAVLLLCPKKFAQISQDLPSQKLSPRYYPDHLRQYMLILIDVPLSLFIGFPNPPSLKTRKAPRLVFSLVLQSRFKFPCSLLQVHHIDRYRKSLINLLTKPQLQTQQVKQYTFLLQNIDSRLGFQT